MRTSATVCLATLATFVWADGVALGLSTDLQQPKARETAVDLDARATQFGHCVCALTDIDGDGVQDFAVGAPHAKGNGARPGAVLFLSGATLQVVRTIPGPATTVEFGASITKIGDLDGDGVPDLAVGMTEMWLETRGGRVFVISGKNGEVLREFDGFTRCFGTLDDVAAHGDVRLLLEWSENHAQYVSIVSAETGREIRVLDTTDQRVTMPLIDAKRNSNAWLGSISLGEHPFFCAIAGPNFAMGRRMSISARASLSELNYPVGARVDFDGDGFEDVVLALPWFNDTAGRVFAFSGKDGSPMYDIGLVAADNA
jgi:hypothetical protein